MQLLLTQGQLPCFSRLNMKRCVSRLGKIQSVAGPILTRYYSFKDEMIVTGHDFLKRIPRFAFRQCHFIGHAAKLAITVRLVGAQVTFQDKFVFRIGVIIFWQR